MSEYIIKFVDNIELPKINESLDYKHSKIERVYDKPTYNVIHDYAKKAKNNNFDEFGIYIGNMDESLKSNIKKCVSDLYDTINFYTLNEATTLQPASPAIQVAPNPTVPQTSVETDKEPIQKSIGSDIYILTPFTLVTFNSDGNSLSKNMLKFYDNVYNYIKDVPLNVNVQLVSSIGVLGEKNEHALLTLAFNPTVKLLQNFQDTSIYKVYQRLGNYDSVKSYNANQLKGLLNNIVLIGDANSVDKVYSSGGKVKTIKNNLIRITGSEYPTNSLNYKIYSIRNEINEMLDKITKSDNNPSLMQQYLYDILSTLEIIDSNHEITTPEKLYDKIVIERGKLKKNNVNGPYKNNLYTTNDYSNYWGNTDIGKFHKDIWHQVTDNDKYDKAVWDDIAKTFNKNNSEGKRSVDSATEKVYNAKHMVKDVVGWGDNDSDELRYDYRPYDSPDIKEKGVASYEKYKIQKIITDNTKQIDTFEKEIVALDYTDSDDAKRIIELKDKIDALNEQNKKLATELSASTRDEQYANKIANLENSSSKGADSIDSTNDAVSRYDTIGQGKVIEAMISTPSYNDLIVKWLCRF